VSLRLALVWEFPLSFEDRPSADLRSEFETLPRALPQLDALARGRSFAPLSAYCDQRPIPCGIVLWMENPPAEDLATAHAAAHGPWQEWFDSSAGLQTVTGLQEALTKPGAGMRLARRSPTLIRELRDLAAGLQRAIDAGVRFRLQGSL